MLTLKGITKNYKVGNGEIEVLKGLDISFRRNEFVSVLGPSGCGKTTTLNIIGGLDKYTKGDLIISGRSTKDFNDKDWDVYRNHRIGFVFQTYNLIPHQTVLGNVELALTIAGVSKEERTKRAMRALERVGLKGEEKKRPNQLSGGQCQRVAIARALVNEPDILLADEPTGALDSKTSVQIMELIKEISKEKLVVMVTHNAEIAEQYSTRIVRLVDGEIVEDTNPYREGEEKSVPPIPQKAKVQKGKSGRTKMSFWTASKLSLRNLITKKGRTVLTSFAGSIGIIGIALILAVSQGTTSYINYVQESTLSTYPITLEKESVDLTALMESFMNVGNGEVDHDKEAIYKDQIIGELVNALAKSQTSENDLKSFKTYLEKEMGKEGSELSNAINGIQYGYDFELDVYTENVNGKIVKSDTGELMGEMIGKYMLGISSNGGSYEENDSSMQNSMFSSMMMGTGMWQELLSERDGGTVNSLIKSQYDLIYGNWPVAHDEIILVVNENNELDDLTLYALGLIGEEEIDKILDAAINGKEMEKTDQKWTYQEVCGRKFKTIMAYDRYKKTGDIYTDWGATESGLKLLYENALELKVVGIIRANEDAENHMLSGSIGYTYKLTEHIIKEGKHADVIKAQLDSPNVDVLTGLPFKSSTETLTDKEKDNAFREYASGLTTVEKKGELFIAMQSVMPKDMLEMGVNTALSQFKLPNGEWNRMVIEYTLATAIASQLGASVDEVKGYFADLSDDELINLIRPAIEEGVKLEYANGVKAMLGTDYAKLSTMLDMTLADTTKSMALYYDEIMEFSKSTYEDNLVLFGYADVNSPSRINIYASSFENKDVIVAAIDKYNSSVDEVKQIKYTDLMGILMSSITTIINAITYVLIAFVAISLIVSSIMIAVITLISVQERTKEIGVLRSIGASKKDVSRMFNAETIIIGLVSGLFGVLVTYALCIPINMLLQTLTGLATLKATLPIGAAGILVGISVLLNLFSGVIPSRSASKKDPVVALRTE
ncbi:MAG: ABC transporter ATP-binding protein/permease [Clostridia bacterium]|nr:ABC transporter ATP-binding protein/permease [Clostridia bacterium]